MEEWLAEDEHHQALLQDWKSCSTIRQKTEAYERLKYSEAWEDFRKARQEKMSLLRSEECECFSYFGSAARRWIFHGTGGWN